MTDDGNATSHPESKITVCAEGRTYAAVVRDVEARYLGIAISKANGNRRRAAQIAGMSYAQFRRKLGNYSIQGTFRVN